MKKLLLSVIAFALITTSCNKYKDDFKNLNARLDALSAQVAGVNTLVTGLAGLSAQITSLQGALTAVAGNVTAIQGSVTTLQTGLTALAGQVTAINTALTALATTVTNGTASTATLIGNLSTLVTANQLATTNALTALTTLINNNQTTNAATFAAMQASLAAIIATQATQSASLATINTTTAATNAIVVALQTQLAIANLNILILLANQNVFDNDLFIRNEAELVFAEGLMNRVNLINGTVEIDNTLFSGLQKARLDVVAGKIYSILEDFNYDGSGTTFTNLTSVGDNVTLGWNTDLLGSINLPALTNVGGDYEVNGSDVNDPMIAIVGDDLDLDYDGDYVLTALTTVVDQVRLAAYTTGGTVVGTKIINIPNLTSAGTITTPTWPSATSVNIGAGTLTTLTVLKATSIRLGQAVYSSSLTILASTTAASTINLSGLDSTTGNLSVTGFTGSTVDLSNYRNGADGSSLTLSAGFAALSLPKYSYGTLFGTGVKTLTAPVYRLSSTKAGAATDLNGLTIIENITIGALQYILSNSEVVEANVKTLALTANGVNAEVGIFAWPELTTATFGGNFSLTAGGLIGWVNGASGGVGLADNPKLASVTTSGIINNFILYNNDATGLTSASLGHAHKVGGPGSYLWIFGNANLTSLTSSADFAKSIIITSNAKLATINLASYVNTILGGDVLVTIHTNKTTGTYTPTVVGTATTARVDCKYTAASVYMAQMKAYLSKFTGVPFAPATPTTAATTTFSIGIDDVDPTAGVQTLDAAMTADAGIAIADPFNTFGYAANGVGTHVNTPTELIKFQ